MQDLTKILIGEGQYDGHVLTRKLPIKIDNALYSLIHFIGGMATHDVVHFAERATEDDLEELYSLIIDFPNTIQAIMPLAGNYKVLRNSEQYQKIVDLIKMVGMEEEMIEEGNGSLNKLVWKDSPLKKHQKSMGKKVVKEEAIPLPGADGFYTTDTNPYFTNYISPKVKQRLFKHWDSLGEADYDSLKLFGVEEASSFGVDAGGFHNVGDVLYPVLALEWLGGVENTKFAKQGWETTSEMGFENLKFKLEPISFDYMFDESENFGESGYACWDIRVLIDKDGDLGLPVNPKFINNYGDYTPYIQDLFPESAQNKLSSYRNYTNEQMELIEGLWEYYHNEASKYSGQFCKVEVKLV